MGRVWASSLIYAGSIYECFNCNLIHILWGCKIATPLSSSIDASIQDGRVQNRNLFASQNWVWHICIQYVLFIFSYALADLYSTISIQYESIIKRNCVYLFRYASTCVYRTNGCAQPPLHIKFRGISFIYYKMFSVSSLWWILCVV